MKELDHNFDQVFSVVKTHIADKKIKITDLPSISTWIMTLVQKRSLLSGEQKKELVTKIVDKIISSKRYFPPAKRNEAKEFIHDYLPSMIDVIINVAKGKIDLSKKKEKLFYCF